ncbi:MAG TPA: T9SS type A sorting domain-containing protein [Prolixibacteraceae bacterium]|nr:T9SS type A sorting domain-containing protein [Prolixibacteraceae bacterium]
MNRSMLIVASGIILFFFTTHFSYALTFVSQTSTPQKTDGTLGTITVVATGSGTVEYRRGLMGTWTTSGHFTNLTSGNYTIYARDGLVIKPISTSVHVDYIVHIPDAIFKNYLVTKATLNTNADGEIQVSEANAYNQPISVGSLGITDMTGLEWFPNINQLLCASNSISVLNLANNLLLRILICNDNLLEELDLSANPEFYYLQCQNNQLSSLNLKNGNNQNQTMCRIYNNNLTCVTVDDPDYSRTHWNEIDPGVAFSMDCSDPAPVINDVELTHIEGCYGDSTGIIHIVASEGDGVFAYSIDSGATWQAGATFNDLPAGSYNIQVKDENAYRVGWELNPEVLTQPEEFLIDNAAATNDDGTGTGSITVTASGGTPPYMYRLDDGEWQESNRFESLAVGTYWVYVRDAHFCIDSADVAITEPLVDIPNAIFKAYLVDNPKINTDGDPEIQVREAEAFTDTIDVGGLGIDDLTGIETFVNLSTLFCDDNLLSSIDLSANTQLVSLRCSDNTLTSLDLTSNGLLKVLHCEDNDLTTLDVLANSKLTYFYCSNNQLSILNLSNNPALYFLDFHGNNLTEIDISVQTTLVSLSCNSNFLSELDVSQNTNLLYLWCSGNGLTELDVSLNTELKDLRCGSNALSALDVSLLPKLEILYCSSNTLTALDVSVNASLEKLDAGDNDLSSLDVSNNPLLTWITCPSNSLTDIDLRNGNQESIADIDFEDNPALTCVSVDDVTYAETNWADDFDPGVTFSLNCHPDPLVIDEVAVSDVTGCFGDANGQIVITASGGVGSLQYSTDNGLSYQASDTLRNLPAGSYDVVVKDEEGDSVIWASNPVLVSEPGELLFDVRSDRPDCMNSNDGIIQFIDVTGGTPPYTYSIDGGESWDSSATFDGLFAGAYELFVRDTNNCETAFPFNPRRLNDPVHDTIQYVSVQNVEGCFGDSTGVIVINGLLPESAPLKSVDGILTYTYSIDNGATWQSSNLFENLPVGAYTALIGVEGCEYPYFDNPVIVENATDIGFSVGYENPVCNGDSDGEICFFNLSGGTAPYSYSIDGGNTWAATDTFRNLAAGSYNLYVKDSNECLKVWDMNPCVLTDPLLFSITGLAVSDNTHCDGTGTGSIRITAGLIAATSLKSIDATAPNYYYSIDGGSTWVFKNYTFSGLTGGSYEVWARSDKECLAEWGENPVVLSDVNGVSIDAVDVVDDDGTSNGQILATVSGGQVPYEYRLDEGTWQASNLFTSLAAGTYLLQVSDQYSCDDTEEVIIADASVPENDTIRGTTFAEDDSLCFGALLTLVVGGDTDEDSVDFEIGSITQLIAGQTITFIPGVHIHAGSFLLARITTDGTFCDEEVESAVAIAETPVKSAGESETIRDRAAPGFGTESCSMKIYPNPNNGSFTLELEGISRPTEVVVSNTIGAVVYRGMAGPGPASLQLHGAPQGIYLVKTIHTPVPLMQKIMVR